MEWARMMRGAKTILDDCASLRAGEQVLIVTDTELLDIGQVLAAVAYERDAEPVLVVIRPRAADGQEPPDPVAEAMKRADVVLAPVSRS
ncbi:leucyl aminopeptidase, partial [miscellaneous Crenarchaeota group-15 archaeon DG-45]